METVQEQRLQLKMKFLLGYNMKIVVLWGNKNLVRVFFFGGGRLCKACADEGILVK